MDYKKLAKIADAKSTSTTDKWGDQHDTVLEAIAVTIDGIEQEAGDGMLSDNAYESICSGERSDFKMSKRQSAVEAANALKELGVESEVVGKVVRWKIKDSKSLNGLFSDEDGQYSSYYGDKDYILAKSSYDEDELEENGDASGPYLVVTTDNGAMEITVKSFPTAEEAYKDAYDQFVEYGDYALAAGYNPYNGRELAVDYSSYKEFAQDFKTYPEWDAKYMNTTY